MSGGELTDGTVAVDREQPARLEAGKISDPADTTTQANVDVPSADSLLSRLGGIIVNASGVVGAANVAVVSEWLTTRRC